MFIRNIYAACAALLLSATLAQNAAALPTAPKTTTTTVTGVYKPLTLDLNTVFNGIPGLELGGSGYDFQVTLTGTFTSTGSYSASGTAGDWLLYLYPTSNVSGNTITFDATSANQTFGSLQYEGGLDVSGLSAADTPTIGDIFFFDATAVGPAWSATCNDGIATCSDYSVSLDQTALVGGPYVYNSDQILTLDTTRENIDCTNGPPCGSITSFAASSTSSSVPEPASLALVGIGLLGLGLGRRRRV
ncbi:MAG: PEP-CTERM sorting domain-containing protein [Gallionellaceae bacterium]